MRVLLVIGFCMLGYSQCQTAVEAAPAAPADPSLGTAGSTTATKGKLHTCSTTASPKKSLL